MVCVEVCILGEFKNIRVVFYSWKRVNREVVFGWMVIFGLFIRIIIEIY